jgi:hypothetical protein
MGVAVNQAAELCVGGVELLATAAGGVDPGWRERARPPRGEQ